MSTFKAYGTHVLYIEQARSDQLDSPYRQRLYVLNGTEYEVISEVWSPTQAAQWVGCVTVMRIVEGDFVLKPTVRSSLSPPKRTSLRAVRGQAAAAPWRAVVARPPRCASMPTASPAGTGLQQASRFGR